MVQIFYHENEIKNIKEKQQADMFKDLLQIKSEAMMEIMGTYGGNKINIASFAPKQKLNEEKKLSRMDLLRRKSNGANNELGSKDFTDVLGSPNSNDTSFMRDKSQDGIMNETHDRVIKYEATALKLEISDIIDTKIKSSPDHSFSKSDQKKLAAIRRKESKKSLKVED